MTFEIFVLLVQDALGTGAIYVLMALGIVLIFNVTRVIFVSYGDLVAYSALTLGCVRIAIACRVRCGWSSRWRFWLLSSRRHR